MKIFISYRRDDSQIASQSIYEALVHELGNDQVFFDIDDIPYGVNFKTHLDRVVSECGIMLVMMGPDWLGAEDAQGRRRLDDPTDFVRIEVESALERGLTVIPVLLKGARMPAADQLPASLSEFSFLNAAVVDWGADLRAHRERLFRVIHRLRGESTPERHQSGQSGAPDGSGGKPWSRRWVAGVGILLVMALVVWVTYVLTLSSPGGADTALFGSAPTGLSLKASCRGHVGENWQVFRVLANKQSPFLNMRAEPSLQGMLLVKLTEGTTLKVKESRAKWRLVEVSDGEHRGKVGWVHQGYIKPSGSLDHYYAVLSVADHKNSKGTPFNEGWRVVRQDRANYHRFDKGDPGDMSDRLYADRARRDTLEAALKPCLDKSVSDVIRRTTAEVWVTTYSDGVRVELAKKGQPVFEQE